MKTLQHAHKVLTDIGMSPYYQSIAKVYKDGKILYSPYSVTVYCPKDYLREYIRLFNWILPHFQLTHRESLQELVIEPEDKKLQLIANAIESCCTVDQVVSAAKLIENSYPEDRCLISALAKKFNSL